MNPHTKIVWCPTCGGGMRYEAQPDWYRCRHCPALRVFAEDMQPYWGLIRRVFPRHGASYRRRAWVPLESVL